MDNLTVRPMRREELDIAVEWAAREGWNPGLRDAEAFWAADPKGFFVAEAAGRMVGTGSMVSYGGDFGFIGFFIVEPDYRHAGIGFPHLGNALLAQAGERLKPGAPVGIDGVFAAQQAYARYGFVFSHRNLRMAGTGRSSPPAGCLSELSRVPFSEVEACDKRHFGYARRAFLERWIEPEGGLALGAVHQGELRGYGVVRPCREGYKIGPLFADDADAAEDLYCALSDRACGKPVYLDIPENNPAARALAERHGLREIFGCTRMYYGRAPELPWENIYGVTSFELG
ncbi:GNAT family N-acetyltransferase [Ruficoccus amylovorans]|uniref:GNAT family N-acetyltransferase n=1 Tax=Ruficoccus amylovorans TaxID=1804625 RepID=A0A842HCX8_9BACT|nr:GNAT family N-acetyltransferase [Ruficoccus amylovorans]MBC2594333.1 GNAT family N-acetyltransferase [Ruficoccus amylovorans]